MQTEAEGIADPYTLGSKTKDVVNVDQNFAYKFAPGTSYLQTSDGSERIIESERVNEK